MRALACLPLMPALLALAPLAALGQNYAPHQLYMSVARSIHILNVCEVATPARQEWLDSIMVNAKKRIAYYTDAERAKLEADMSAALAREFPRKPSKEFCADFVKNLDLERKTLIRD